jgi:hypothetical protein
MVQMGGMGGGGVVFTNNGAEPEESGTTLVTGGRKGRNKDHITCFKCHEKGHYVGSCPNDTTKDDDTDAAYLLIAGVEKENSMNLCLPNVMAQSLNHETSWTTNPLSMYSATPSYYRTSAPQKEVWSSIVMLVRPLPTWLGSSTFTVPYGIILMRSQMCCL